MVGWFLWNATAIFEMDKTSYRTRKPFSWTAIWRTIPRTKDSVWFHGHAISPERPVKTLIICSESNNRSKFLVKFVNLARFGNSMVAIISVHNQIYSRNREEFTKVSRADRQAENHLQRQFFGMRQILWRTNMKSLYMNAPSIRDKWYCWKSGTQNWRKHFCCAVTIRLGWKLWAASKECHCYLRSIQDFLWDGETHYYRRHWTIQKPGYSVRFDDRVSSYFSAKDQSIFHRLVKFFSWSIFGHALYAGRVWKGEILVASIEELDILDASELHVRKFNANEIFMPRTDEHFISPIGTWNSQIVGKRSSFRKSISIQN